MVEKIVNVQAQVQRRKLLNLARGSFSIDLMKRKKRSICGIDIVVVLKISHYRWQLSREIEGKKGEGLSVFDWL
jgi:hypothetical protein